MSKVSTETQTPQPECPGCGYPHGARQSLWKKQDEFLACPECRLEFAYQADYSEEFYQEQYRTGEYSLSRSKFLSKRQMIRESPSHGGACQKAALEWLKDHTPYSPVLEIGCGWGWFLAALEREGFIAYGTDIAQIPIDNLWEKGFSVSTTYSPAPYRWHMPQAICMWEVLEHLPNPGSFLRGLHEQFPQAPVLVSMPSPYRWTLRFGREYYDKPPFHLTRWTDTSAPFVFHAAGYNHVSVTFLRMEASELYSAVIGRLLHPSRLPVVRCAQQSASGTRWAARLYDLGLAIARHLPCPPWSSSSMLVIAEP